MDARMQVVVRGVSPIIMVDTRLQSLLREETHEGMLALTISKAAG